MIVRESVFQIAELVRRTGVPRATVHYYRRLGLLPEPTRVASNRFLYDQRHVDALHAISFLRGERGMPLDGIRRVLPGLLEQGDREAFDFEGWRGLLETSVPASIADAPPVRILREAATAFATRGYAQLNLDDVAAAAGVAKGSLYRHHDSKQSLFLAVIDWTMADAGDRFGQEISQHWHPDEPAVVHLLAEILDPLLPLLADLFARAVREPHPYARRGVAAWFRLVGEITHDLQRHTSLDPVRANELLVQAFGAVLGRVAGQLGVRPFAAGRIRQEG